MRTFDPRIGSQYTATGFRGVRVLILGEAHYGVPEDTYPAFTANVVRKLGQQQRFPFFTRTQRLVSGGRGWLSDAERAEFWEKVAFYNYIQSFPGDRSRIRPTPEMWAAAREPFLHTLAELAPQVLVVLGFQLQHHLPQLPPEIHVAPVQHPSSRGFKYADWQPVVQAALDAAQAQSA